MGKREMAITIISQLEKVKEDDFRPFHMSEVARLMKLKKVDLLDLYNMALRAMFFSKPQTI
jgi:hypothetical protein